MPLILFVKKIILTSKNVIRSIFTVTSVIAEMNLVLGEVGNPLAGRLGPLTRLHGIQIICQPFDAHQWALVSSK